MQAERPFLKAEARGRTNTTEGGSGMDFGQIVAPTIKELFIERIEGMILSGTLKPGDRLPSEREHGRADEDKQDDSPHRAGGHGPHGLPGGSRRAAARSWPTYAESGNLETLNAILRYNGGKLDRQMVVSIIELRSAVEGGALIRLGRKHTQSDMDELRELLADYAERAAQRPGRQDDCGRARPLPLPYLHPLGQPALPAHMNAFRSVGSVLWADSARFWGCEALLEQGGRSSTSSRKARARPPRTTSTASSTTTSRTCPDIPDGNGNGRRAKALRPFCAL